MKKIVIAVLIILLGSGVIFGIMRHFKCPSCGESVDNPLIKVSSPASGDKVASPLTITGEARGNWYFEASFPVEILDANGNQLGQHYAQAQGEWMTTEFVPFISTLEFSTPTTPSGTLVLHKDNPSDQRELDDEFRIPVRFK